MTASVSDVSRRASGVPFRTDTHSVTYTAVTMLVTSDFTSAEIFGASDPTTSIASTSSDATTGATSTATAGLLPGGLDCWSSGIASRPHAAAKANRATPAQSTTPRAMV